MASVGGVTRRQVAKHLMAFGGRTYTETGRHMMEESMVHTVALQYNLSRMGKSGKKPFSNCACSISYLVS